MFEAIKSLFRAEVAIDLGTAYTLVYYRGQIVLREPSVVAVDPVTGEAIAVGREAKRMLGKVHEGIRAKRPIRDGVIENLDLVQLMLTQILKRVLRRRIGRPVLFVAIPSGASEVERKAVWDAGVAAGASEVFLVQEPIAAAVGSGLNIHEPKGHMVVDIGGGTTEIAIITQSGIASQTSIDVAGDEMDQAIIDYVRATKELEIGEQQAEEIKIKIGNVHPEAAEGLEPMKIAGKDIRTSMPKEVELRPSEVREALRGPLSQIVAAVKRAFEKPPADLVADVTREGIHLVGGGALIRGMARVLEAEVRVPVVISQDPLECVVKGVGEIMSQKKRYKEVIITPGKPTPLWVER